MDYLERYKSRLIRKGNNVGEVYSNNTIAFKEATFSESPTFRVLEVISYEFADIQEMDSRVVEVERMGTLRQVLFRPYQGLNIGTYVKFDNQTWLIIDQWGDKDTTKYSALVEKCNRTLKWKDESNNIVELDCIASQSPLGSKASQGKEGIEWNKYDVSLPLGRLYVFVENNDSSMKVGINHRFIFGRNVYEVVGVDDTSFINKDGYGLIQLLVEVDVKRDTDDFKNNIAFNDYKISVPDIDTTTPPSGNTGDTGGSIW